MIHSVEESVCENIMCSILTLDVKGCSSHFVNILALLDKHRIICFFVAVKRKRARLVVGQSLNLINLFL